MMTEEGHRFLVPLGEAFVFSAAGFISTADVVSGDEAMVAKIQEKGVIPNRKRWYDKIWMRSRDRLNDSLWWNRFGGDIGRGGLSTATSGETRLVSLFSGENLGHWITKDGLMTRVLCACWMTHVDGLELRKDVWRWKRWVCV
ncbi:hypothetical protein Rs2_15445 [Raphanus sativus]|nr:hypothetical protein Rs2_15445 [Raphanus sativus]